MTTKVANSPSPSTQESVSEPCAIPDVPTITSPPEPSEEKIRQLAYAKWEAAGKPIGDCLTFWLAAKAECCRP